MNEIDEAALITLLDAASIYKEIIENDYGNTIYSPRLTRDDDADVTIITDPAEALKLVDVTGEGLDPPLVYVAVLDEVNNEWVSSPYMTTKCARVLAISLLNVAMEMEAAGALAATIKANPRRP